MGNRDDLLPVLLTTFFCKLFLINLLANFFSKIGAPYLTSPVQGHFMGSKSV